MKWPAMGYARVESLDELWRALDAAGPEAQILAGGQSLLATLAFRLSAPSTLIDITRIAALKGVSVAGDVLRIGALTRHADLARDALVARHAPMLAKAAPLIAHPAIRNRGTIGGSLALADPAAELPACAVALGATVVLAAPTGERRVAASDFFQGLFTAALEPGEIITAVEVPVATASSRQTIVEVTRRSGDYAMAGLAAALEMDGAGIVTSARLVFFGIGSGAEVARGASATLTGKALSAETIAAAQAALDGDLDPPTDLHGGPEMKRHLARVLTRRALTAFLVPSEQAA
ncbi:xanthine dehydrogenase family protein subunit M [Phreatobacter sp.]|uniref:FAD binding domain-containing protein n=1 Tax=Phreatobacter sp. TaxID=1966341 RepID=UPI0022C2C083|nr:xanthine dehydrogenase family protein subunit M [Phreatobacter sp.]MCZ8316915.1 xanthine dehydrogenase family protein subunit M [Phreatobacter sp.]